MGILPARPQPQSQPDNLPQTTSYTIWQESSKSPADTIAYLEAPSTLSENQVKTEIMYVFLTSITNREQLYSHLSKIEQYLLEPNSQPSLSKLQLSELVQCVHSKLSSILFAWNILNTHNITASAIHERILPEISSLNDSEKLQCLYDNVVALQLQQLHNNIDYKELISKAVITNYPFLITKETLSKLFAHIIETQIFIQDTNIFHKFLQTILQQLESESGHNECVEYIQKLSQYLPEAQVENINSLLTQIHNQNNKISDIVIECAYQFLDVGYPHALESVFEAVIDVTGEVGVHRNMYFLIKVYGLFIYVLGEVTMQFRELKNMDISEIMHLSLKNHNLEAIAKLKEIYILTNAIPSKLESFSFEDDLCKYIFSPMCPLQLCLLLTPLYIPEPNPEMQQSLFLKLNNSKIEVIIENQALVKNTIKCLESNAAFLEVGNKIDELLEICRLFYMFGVNEKFKDLSCFYCPYAVFNFENNNLDEIEILWQEKTLMLFKAMISKFYTKQDRSKKILLTSQSSPNSKSTQIAVDLSKPESILQITQYLYDSIFRKGLHSTNELHQIILQHMIYFYKYEEAKVMLSESMVANYKINIETMQIIIIENITEELKKTTNIQKALPDIETQLKLVKNMNRVEIQNVKSFVKLVKYLNEHNIELTYEQKSKIDINLLYCICNKYTDRIEVLNFDRMYEDIRCIEANYIVDPDTQWMMTNELLKFKSKLAAKAFEVGKNKLANELVDEISRFNPPWLTTELIQIFANSSSKIDKRIYGIALKSCSKGSDLKFLMHLWKQQQGKERKKEKGFTDITEYFETGREYLIIDDSLIQNEEKYRNYVAECQFNDEHLHFKKYELFFVLLGSEPERAFHYALKVELDPFKIDMFLKEAMKTYIIDVYACAKFLHKYFYFANEQQEKDEIISYAEYSSITLRLEDLKGDHEKLQSKKDKSIVESLYYKAVSAYLCSKLITPKFIEVYFEEETKSKTSIAYEVLFDEKSRKSLLLELRDEPMGRSDVLVLESVCKEVLSVKLIDLCIFSLANLANTSQQIDEKIENIVNKLITLTEDKVEDAKEIVMKLTEKIFSLGRLVEILSYIRKGNYKELINERKLEIIQCLSSVELGQEFQGMLPPNFFLSEIKYLPVWPLSAGHEKLIRKCWRKTNIFVLSKVLNLMYGMNPEIEKKIWKEYLECHPEEDVSEIRNKLEYLS